MPWGSAFSVFTFELPRVSTLRIARYSDVRSYSFCDAYNRSRASQKMSSIDDLLEC